MQARSLITLTLAATTVLISGCNPVLRTHGYVATEEAKPQAVEPGSDTKSSVLARLGNPSVRGTFDEEIETDTWYYMNQVRQSFAYLRPLVEERSVTAISFNSDGQVEQVAEYGIEDGYYVNIVDRKTPTRGRELSVLEQIFGSVGRLPTSTLGGSQPIPGGGGGPSGGQ